MILVFWLFWLYVPCMYGGDVTQPHTFIGNDDSLLMLNSDNSVYALVPDNLIFRYPVATAVDTDNNILYVLNSKGPHTHEDGFLAIV
ncbi:hypothetical protein EBQ93_00480, partial [bacterium]|nr:hypothetical protein [bacterium]